ncbi:MAG TPA: DUF1028 domain-containing protein [Casimicrobiaceae bacterium]|nr:DUF1028 domain-containing protein [Casimicrobiaceae bacterium]
MTWSIVARDTDGAFGVAVASKAFAVGALCPYARSGVGALCTQALVNLHYATPGLDLLAQGTPPEEVVRLLTAPDEGRDHRQLHIVDARGRTAAYTGAKCVDWCGHRPGADFSVAGNMLTGPDVVDATVAAYQRDSTLTFAERLLNALSAGERAGGDKRGKQAAALLIYTTERYPRFNMRVDDHADPIEELKRLYEKSFERYQALLDCLPSRARPFGVTDRAEVEAAIARFQAAHSRSG